VPFEHPYPAVPGEGQLRLDRADRVGEPVARHVQAAANHVPVEQAMHAYAVCRLEHLTPAAPRSQPTVPPVQIGQPGLAGSDLEAADRVEATEPGELVDGVPGKPRHRLRRVGLEDETRGVGARPAWAR